MAKSDGYVLIDTTLNTDGFGKGVKNMNKQMGGLTGTVGKLGLAIAAAFSVKALINFGKQSIKLGSDLQEVQNVVDVTFTEMNEQVNEFARNAAETAGLSETMAKRYAGTFGAMAKAFGFAESEAFDMSASLTQLAGDVASFYNLTQDEAYTKLKSVFTGETESLKDLGVVMTQSALDSFAMAKGYGKTTKAMSEQEKVALRYAFVLDQLSTASGDFARTSDSWANQTKILSLNMESLKANVGQALINVFTPFLQTVNKIVARMAELSAYLVTFSETIMGKSSEGNAGDAQKAIANGYEDIADATEEANKAQNKYLTGLDEIQTFSSSAGESTNIGSVEGIGGASGQNDTDNLEKTSSVFEKIKSKIEDLRDSTKWFAEDILSLSVAFVRWYKEDMSPVLERWGEKFDELWKNHLSKLWEKIAGFFGGIAKDLRYLWENFLQPIFDWFVNKALPFLTPAIEGIGDIFMDVIGQIADVIGYVIDILGGLISFIVGTFTGGWEKAWEGVKEIFAGIINIIALLIEGLVNTFVYSLNGVISGLNDLISIGGIAEFFGFEGIPTIPKFDIPELATGAVIPPNAPFMAMLGDQKHGTNIEAPLDTIKQAVREVMGNGGGGRYSFSAQINRRVLFEELIEEAKLRQDTTGRNPFDLA